MFASGLQEAADPARPAERRTLGYLIRESREDYPGDRGIGEQRVSPQHLRGAARKVSPAP